MFQTSQIIEIESLKLFFLKNTRDSLVETFLLPSLKNSQLLKSFQHLVNGRMQFQIPITQWVVLGENTLFIIIAHEHKKSKYLFLLTADRNETTELVECNYRRAS